MSARWEYRVMQPPFPQDFGHTAYGVLERAVNIWGAEGWELVGTGVGALWFKRPLPQTTDCAK